MAAAVQAPLFYPALLDRCVRLCPVHGCTLTVEWRSTRVSGKVISHSDVLVCAGNGKRHDVRTWVAYDRERRKLYGAGTAARVCVVNGECEEALAAVLETGRIPADRHEGAVSKTDVAYWRRRA